MVGHRNRRRTSGLWPLHDDMTAAPPHFNKSVARQDAADFLAGKGLKERTKNNFDLQIPLPPGEAR